jgi:dipeptidyl aminopeptidase/acylaminoacyl peptidase
VFTEYVDSRTKVDIMTVPVPRDWAVETDRTPRPFLQTASSEFHPALSPDGRWMAYVSDASGRWEVYVAPYPGPGPSEQISTGGGSEPLWSPDGRTLYYRSLGARNIAREMMAVAVRPADGRDGQALEIGPPRVLFDGPYFQCSEWGRSYDLAPDGSRFLMVHDQRPELAATQINVVVNWFAELAAL